MLIKLTNTSGTPSAIPGIASATVPDNGAYYVQLGQGRIITNVDGTITHFAVTNGNNTTAVTGWRVEVGLSLIHI